MTLLGKVANQSFLSRKVIGPVTVGHLSFFGGCLALGLYVHHSLLRRAS